MCCAAVRGATRRTGAARRIATGSVPMYATGASAFVSVWFAVHQRPAERRRSESKGDGESEGRANVVDRRSLRRSGAREIFLREWKHRFTENSNGNAVLQQSPASRSARWVMMRKRITKTLKGFYKVRLNHATIVGANLHSHCVFDKTPETIVEGRRSSRARIVIWQGFAKT